MSMCGEKENVEHEIHVKKLELGVLQEKLALLNSLINPMTEEERQRAKEREQANRHGFL